MDTCNLCGAPTDIIATMQIEATTTDGRATLKKFSGEAEQTEQVVCLCHNCASMVLGHLLRQKGAA